MSGHVAKQEAMIRLSTSRLEPWTGAAYTVDG